MIDFFDTVQNINIEKTNRNVSFYNIENSKNISVFDIAILGICSDKNIDEISTIRNEFYKLYLPKNIDILDFGNIIEKNNFEQTSQQIQKVVELAVYNNLKLVIIGESRRYNIGVFKNYSKRSAKFTHISAGAEIYFDGIEENYDSRQYLDFFILNKALIEDLYYIGYQNFLVNKEITDYFRQKKYRAYRLSEIKEDLLDIEPYFRNSDIVSMNLGVVKNSDCPASPNPQPAGLDTTEFCKLSYFAGLSKSLKIFGIYDFSLEKDINNISAKLIAQSIWHYLDAFSLMKNYTIKNKNDYSVFHLHIDNKKELKLKFVHYDKIDLWWLAIKQDKYEQLIPCSFKDFNKAKNGQLSQRINFIIEKYKSQINL